MSDEDFPAAHSMDTHWFAVDREGHVGCFETGEAGGIPTNAGSHGEPLTVEQILLQMTESNPVEYYVDDLLAIPGGPVFEGSYRGQGYGTASFHHSASCYCILMLLKQSLTVASLKESSSRSPSEPLEFLMKHMQRIPNRRHPLGYIEGPMPVVMLQRLVQTGLLEKGWVNHRLTSNRLGFFQYAHGNSFENWAAGPYVREDSPMRPLKIQDLPIELQREFERAQFSKRNFAKDPVIDPREIGECRSWGQAWVGMDGIVHGFEEDEP